MFRDAHALDRQRTAAGFETALRRYAASTEQWYTGTVDSVDARLASCASLLHLAQAAVARLGISDSGRYMQAARHLEADREALGSLREDLLTGAAGREDVTGPPGWRSANRRSAGLMWDIDDNDNHVAYDGNDQEVARAYQHPDDGQWYVKRNIDGQPGDPHGPFADKDTAKTYIGQNMSPFEGGTDNYWEANPVAGSGKAAPGHGHSQEEAQEYFNKNAPPEALQSEKAVHDWAERYNPPIPHPDHPALEGRPIGRGDLKNLGKGGGDPIQTLPSDYNNLGRGQEAPAGLRRYNPQVGPHGENEESPHYDAISDRHWKGDQPHQSPNAAPGQMSLFSETPHEQLPDLKKYMEPQRRRSNLAGTDRRWVELEAAKFVAANTDTLDDSHELAVRAAAHAEIKTSTFPRTRSAAISEAFVARVGDLGRQSYRPAVKTAAAFQDFDPQALFLP